MMLLYYNVLMLLVYYVLLLLQDSNDLAGANSEKLREMLIPQEQ